MIHARDDYNRIQDPAGLIPDDEPVFLIRGQDRFALPTIQAWIDAARRHGASADIIDLASKHLPLIVAWQQEHGTKTPDLPAHLQYSPPERPIDEPLAPQDEDAG